MELYLNSTVPSLISLVVLCFLPWSARRSHSQWRALQAYDRQKPAVKSSRLEPVLSTYMVAIHTLVGLFVLLVVVIFTCGINRQNSFPLFVNLRHVIPWVFLFLSVFLALSTLVTMVFKPLSNVSRVLSSQQKYTHTVTSTQREHRRSLINTLLNGRYALVFNGILSIFIIRAALSVTEHSGVVLAMIATNILVIVHLNVEPLVLGTQSSFRGFVLVPVLGLLFGLIQQGIYYLLAFIILEVMKVFHYNPFGTTSVFFDCSWGPCQLATDVEANQSILLLFVPLYCLASWFPCALVALAYRYDAAQADQSTLSDEEVDQLVLQSVLPVDDLGRKPILLQDADLHASSKLSWKQLPTFLAALGTMIGIQVIGLIFDALSGWQPGTFFPTRPDQLASTDDTFSINIWALASYPLVILAMIIRVHLHPERSFRSLWSFHEKWYLDPPSSNVHSEHDEGEELMEWRKLPAEEWISVPSD